MLRVHVHVCVKALVVRTINTSTQRRGSLPKRMHSASFRSVLSMDVEYRINHASFVYVIHPEACQT